MSSESLKQFRTIASRLFRLVFMANDDHAETCEQYDSILQTIMELLVSKERALNVHIDLEQHASTMYSDMFLGRNDLFEPTPKSPKQSGESVPCSVVTLDGPTLRIHNEPVLVKNANIVVTKDSCESMKEDEVLETAEEEVEVEEEEEGEVVEEVEEAEEEEPADEEGEVVEEVEEEEAVEEEAVEAEEEEPADEEGEVVEEVEEEEAVEEEAEEEEAVEEEAEEEEGVELIKIGRKQYFIGEQSKLVYEAIDEDTPGQDPIGRYENGKLTKL